MEMLKKKKEKKNFSGCVRLNSDFMVMDTWNVYISRNVIIWLFILILQL